MINKIHKNILISALALVAGAPVWAQTEYWKADFKNGKFPANTEVWDYMGEEVISSVYRRIDPAKAWSVATIGDIYAAFSPSHNRTSTAVSNAFFTPYFNVDDSNAILRWQARSVLPGFAESYDIYYRSEDAAGKQSDLTLFYTQRDEEDVWTQRSISLASLAGEKIQLAFVCTSEDKYLLGMTDIWAGVPADVRLSAVDKTKKFVANADKKEIVISITSAGVTPSDVSLVFKTDEGEVELSADEWGGTKIRPGEWITVTAPVDFPADTKSNFTVSAKQNGKLTQLASGTVWSSMYERTLLIDDGTGMWCNNCPTGIMEIESMQRTYGSQVAVIATHINDLFGQPDYWAQLKWYDIPRMMANRNRTNNGATISKILPSFDMPTEGRVDISSINVTSSETATINGQAEFGFDFDNSEGRYGLEYVITFDFRRFKFEKDYYQENNCSLPMHQQYYFLPSKIPSDLAIFRHLNAEATYGFTPMEGKMPASIEKGVTYDFSFDVTLPSVATTWNNCHIVAFVVDTETGHVVNAASAPIKHTPQSGATCLSALSNRATWCNGTLSCNLDENETAIAEVYSLSGMLLEKVTLSAGCTHSPAGEGTPRIIRISGNNINEVLKVN